MSQQRVRLDIEFREEIRKDDDEDFPGRAELRLKITQAREAGDIDLLRRLQRQHLQERLAFRQTTCTAGAPSRSLPGAEPAGGTVVRTSHHVLALTGRGDMTHELVAYPLTWGSKPTVIEDGERGERLVSLNIQPPCIAGWFRSVRPMAIALVADHATDRCGGWHSFAIDDVGLRSTGLVDPTPAGEELLAACSDGRAAGFSFKARILKSHASGRTVGGLPEVIADSIWIEEAGPTPDPSDERAVILSVGGKVPAYRAQAALAGAQPPTRGHHARRRVGWPGRRGWRWSS